MFASFKNRLSSVIAPDIPDLPYNHDNILERRIHQRMLQRQELLQKFPYGRPGFLQLLTEDEIKASADHNVRPIIVPRDIGLLPWTTGYAECVNSGKSKWNEDQCAFYQNVLSDPTQQYPNLSYTYFGIFDGHAGYGAALSASHQFHHILHEKLVDSIELLLPHEGMINTQTVNSFPHPRYFQRSVSQDELIIGALESAFMDMDKLIDQERIHFSDNGGCTACVSLFINGKMYVANAGDSRAVLCQKKFTGNPDKANTQCDGSEDSFAEPFSFDHTPETERLRLLGVAEYKPKLMENYYTAMEFAKRPRQCDLGQRILCRQGTNKGWFYKTLTPNDLKMPIISGEGKRSRLLGTLGVTRGFGDHSLLAIATGTRIKPFLTPQPDVTYRDLTKIVTIPDEHNEDGDYGILIMATDGLWDVSENDAVARTVFQTLHKYPTEKHRYTMVAQELVAKARGKINSNGHWRLADSKAAATVDDISVIVIPVYQYYKEHVEYQQKCLNDYRKRKEIFEIINGRNERLPTEGLETEVLDVQQQQQEQISNLVNGMQEMAHVVVEPDREESSDSTMAVDASDVREKVMDEEITKKSPVVEKIEDDELDKALEKFEAVKDPEETGDKGGLSPESSTTWPTATQKSI